MDKADNQNLKSSHESLRSPIYKAVLFYFVLVFLASMWPIYPLFSKISPMVVGLPFSLFYLVFLLVLSFCVLLGLYLWESRHGKID